ncbi:SDR family oxidoreductase [Streptomyces sp. NBC_01136]|uniref:SDR family oxidoreductase n=1 Tax=unclassified Streptomyces TaxID=2593676 RepID=UPI003247328F|nr:SDR family oxidoreductase [Streptomyces sp. NBC_01136]
MTPSVPARVLVTGIGGAVGRGLAEALAADPPAAEVVGVFSGERSRDAFMTQVPRPVRALVRPVVCDLADAGRTSGFADELPPADRTVVVHAAANVSWTASPEAARHGNVTVTRNVADLARGLGPGTRFLYVSSAYTATEGWHYRNTYESTKAEAQRLLCSAYADLAPSVFSCSLVVGHSRTGAIGRFHGIYPLLALIDRHSPVLLPGERDRRIDIVPVDWVAAELAGMVHRTLRGGTPQDVVAAAGPAAPRLGELVTEAVGALNRLRARAGGRPLEPIALVPFRRWDFLRRSFDAWQVKGVALPDRALLDRLIGVYRPYFEDDRVLAPTAATRPCPPWQEYLDAVVGHWFAQQGRRARTPVGARGGG